VIFRSAVTARASSLSTIRRMTSTQVSTMTLQAAKRAKYTFEKTVTRQKQNGATCHSGLHTVDPDYNGAWLDQVGMMLTGDVKSLATNPASNSALLIIEDVFRDAQGRGGILLSLLHATPALKRHYGLRSRFL